MPEHIRVHIDVPISRARFSPRLLIISLSSFPPPAARDPARPSCPYSFFVALLRAKYAAESLYHHGCGNNRGLTVPAIYCGHIFILTLIATWYRPRA